VVGLNHICDIFLITLDLNAIPYLKLVLFWGGLASFFPVLEQLNELIAHLDVLTR